MRNSVSTRLEMAGLAELMFEKLYFSLQRVPNCLKDDSNYVLVTSLCEKFVLSVCKKIKKDPWLSEKMYLGRFLFLKDVKKRKGRIPKTVSIKMLQSKLLDEADPNKDYSYEDLRAKGLDRDDIRFLRDAGVIVTTYLSGVKAFRIISRFKRSSEVDKFVLESINNVVTVCNDGIFSSNLSFPVSKVIEIDDVMVKVIDAIKNVRVYDRDSPIGGVLSYDKV